MRGIGFSLSAQRDAWDLSTSYDYGSAINAFAKCFAVRNPAAAADDAPNRDELRSLFDQYLQHYGDLFANAHAKQPNAISSRDLSFVILGLTTMYKTTNAEDYRKWLARLCEILIEFEVPFRGRAGSPASGFLMRMDSPRTALSTATARRCWR